MKTIDTGCIWRIEYSKVEKIRFLVVFDANVFVGDIPDFGFAVGVAGNDAGRNVRAIGRRVGEVVNQVRCCRK